MNTGVRPHNLFVITACVVFVTLISLNVSAQDRFSIENSADWDIQSSMVQHPFLRRIHLLLQATEFNYPSRYQIVILLLDMMSGGL